MSGPIAQVVIDNTTDRAFTGIHVYDRDNGGTFVGPGGETLPTPGANTTAGEWFFKTGAAAGLYQMNDVNDTWVAVFSGNVNGPDSATDRTIPVYDGATGKLLGTTTIGVTSNGDMSGLRTVSFAGVTTINATGGAATITLAEGQKFILNMNNQPAVVVTLNTPNGVSNSVVEIVQGTTPTTNITWETEGTEDVLAATADAGISPEASSISLLGAYFNGTNFYLAGAGPMESIM